MNVQRISNNRRQATKANASLLQTWGLKGVVGQRLTPPVAAEYVSAFAAHLANVSNGGQRLRVCIGKDSRSSGSMLEAAAIAGLSACGVDVVRLGPATTACVSVMTGHLDCAGGIMIAASCCPECDNGIKLLLGKGAAPTPHLLADIHRRYLGRDFGYVSSAQIGHVYYTNTSDEVHIDKIRAVCRPDVIANNSFRVVLDGVNGAGGGIARKLLEMFGCTVIGLNLEPTGVFAHDPEPAEEHLQSLCGAVKEHSADIGFAQTPDGERVAIVDNRGTYIGVEYTPALAMDHVLSQTKSDIVCTLSASHMIDVVAERYNRSVYRTPVGEASVVETMLDKHCLVGGDDSGGVIDLRVSCVCDSLVVMATVLQMMADRSQSISEIVDDYSTQTDRWSVGEGKHQNAKGKMDYSACGG